MTEAPAILVAEDDDSDVLFLRRAFKEAGLVRPVHFVHDGREAIEFLWQRRDDANDRLPALVILDLKMPRRTGLEVLHWIRSQSVLRCLPVLIFSSSARREDIERSYTLGASGFFVKPASTVQRTELARFLKTWLELNQPPLGTSEGYKAAAAAHAVQPFNSPL